MRLLRLLAKTSRSAIGFKRTPMAPLAVPRAASVATTPAQDSNANAQNHESYRAHIDFKFVRDNVDLVRQNATNRLVNASPDEVVRLYDEFVALTQESDAVRAARNENSAQMKRKLEADEREKLIEHGKSLKLELDTIDEKLRAVEARLQIEGKKLPNLTHPDVPIGAEDEATLIAEIGSKAAFGFEAKDHVTLGEALGVLDFDTGSVVSGSKFYYLRKEAALLEMALVRGRSVLVFPLMRSPVAFLADTRALFFSRSRFLALSASDTDPDSRACLAGQLRHAKNLLQGVRPHHHAGPRAQQRAREMRVPAPRRGHTGIQCGEFGAVPNWNRRDPARRYVYGPDPARGELADQGGSVWPVFPHGGRGGRRRRQGPVPGPPIFQGGDVCGVHAGTERTAAQGADRHRG